MTTKASFVKQLSPAQQKNLLVMLQKRFSANMHRHPNMNWDDLTHRLEQQPEKLWSLNAMEETGGAPDVVEQNTGKKDVLFFDCSSESPIGRRSLCYDRRGWQSRKDARPTSTAMDVAAAMGISLLSEEEYRHLQSFGAVDTKTSSWLATPDTIRALGGALFGDCRYGAVFVYHNGAQSYYAARGFRGVLSV